MFVDHAPLDSKDPRVVSDQFLAFHALAARLGANQNRVVCLAESDSRIIRQDDIVQQGHGTVLEFHADTLSITGASMALNLSDVPFTEVVSGVRVGRIDGEFVINPSIGQLEESDLDLIVAGTDDIVCMIEGECLEVEEDRADDVGTMVRDEMCSAIELSVPLVVDLGRGSNWEEAH